MWLLPTRNRLANLQRFFAACGQTGVSTPGLVLVDEMDYAEHQARYDELQLPPQWKLRLTRGLTQGEKTREIWDEIVDRDWVGRLGDDNVPVTPFWDRRWVDALDGWNVISCNDGWQAPRRIADCWVISGQLLRAVGYIFAPGMHHLFVDDLWETIGREASCWKCDMNVLVRHLHILKGDAPADATHRIVYGNGFTRENRGPDRIYGMWSGDERSYRAWLDGDRHRIIREVRKHRLAAVEKSANHDPANWQMTALPDLAFPRGVSRNAPCPCGSNKKYKHCHGKQA